MWIMITFVQPSPGICLVLDNIIVLYFFSEKPIPEQLTDPNKPTVMFIH